MNFFDAIKKEAGLIARKAAQEEKTTMGISWHKKAQTTDKTEKPGDRKDLGEKEKLPEMLLERENAPRVRKPLNEITTKI